MTGISDNLRALMVSARTDPDRWGLPKGLSQAALAEKTGLTETYIRRIETGHAANPTANTIGKICFILGIDSDTATAFGDFEVARAIQARTIVAENNLQASRPRAAKKQIEEHLRETPGLTEDEKNELVEAAGAILRREEPFTRQLWQRREQKGKK